MTLQLVEQFDLKADLLARWILFHIAESEYQLGNRDGANRFFNADSYLRDRVRYKRWRKVRNDCGGSYVIG